MLLYMQIPGSHYININLKKSSPNQEVIAQNKLHEQFTRRSHHRNVGGSRFGLFSPQWTPQEDHHARLSVIASDECLPCSVVCTCTKTGQCIFLTYDYIICVFARDVCLCARWCSGDRSPRCVGMCVCVWDRAGSERCLPWWPSLMPCRDP